MAILLWSPDSEKIATYKQDQRHVSDMYLVETKVGEPRLETWKYPIPQDSAIICGEWRAYQDDVSAVWWCNERSGHVFFPAAA